MLDQATWAFIRDLGFGGLATFALIGGFRGWYVWRREHEAAISRLDEENEEIRVDRDFWRAIALKSMGHAEQALEVVKAKDA